MLDSDSPGAEDLGPAAAWRTEIYVYHGSRSEERLGWGIQFRGRLAPPKEDTDN